jgi:hypothetical protein
LDSYRAVVCFQLVRGTLLSTIKRAVERSGGKILGRNEVWIPFRKKPSEEDLVRWLLRLGGAVGGYTIFPVDQGRDPFSAQRQNWVESFRRNFPHGWVLPEDSRKPGVISLDFVQRQAILRLAVLSSRSGQSNLRARGLGYAVTFLNTGDPRGGVVLLRPIRKGDPSTDEQSREGVELFEQITLGNKWALI